jgi:hypothetical protein
MASITLTGLRRRLDCSLVLLRFRSGRALHVPQAASAPAPDTDGDVVQFSRSVGGPFGKFDFDAVKAHLDEHTYNLFLQKCARREKVPGALARDLIYVFVHGGTVAEVMAKLDRQLLDGEGPNQGQLGKLREMGIDGGGAS